MNFAVLLPALEVGLIYGMVAIAVYLTYKVLDFPDLTVDGSFPTGACVSAVALVGGIHPALALALAFAAGAAAGLVTAYLSLRLKIASLLASILVMTALYSINLRIVGGPNVALIGVDGIFDRFAQFTGFERTVSNLVLLGSMVAALTGGLVWFFKTELGMMVRATGANPAIVASFGGSVKHATLLATSLSNGLVALAGGVFAQYQCVADVGLGVGTIIYGLIAVITGTIFTSSRSIAVGLCGTVAGAIAFRCIVGEVVAMDALVGGIKVAASDLNLLTSTLVIGLLALGRFKPGLRRLA